MKEITYVITDPVGLHARPAGTLVNFVKNYSSAIEVYKGEKKADGKKLMALMFLGIKQGDEIKVTATGLDEDIAIEAVEKFLKENL